MAIAIDQANAGTAANDASSTTIAVNTTAIIASGGFIVVSVGWWHASATLSSLSGGGLTWSIAVQHKHPSNNVQSAIAWAQAPSGLASGSTITATFSVAANGRQIGISSFTGVATSSPVDTTGSTDNVTSAWTGSATIAAGSVLLVTSHADNFRTSTITSPSIEALDWNDGANTGQTTGYRIESTGGTYSVAGTFNTSSNHADCIAAFKVSAGGGTDLTVTPGAPNVAWSGSTPSRTSDISRTPGTPNVAWTGSTPGVLVDKTFSPGTPNVAWAGSTPSVVIDKTLTPGTPVVAWAGTTPGLVLQGEVTVTPGAAVVAWSGSTPVLTVVPDVVIEPPSQGGDGGDGLEDFSTVETRNLLLRPGQGAVRWSGSRAAVRVDLDPVRFRFARRRERPVAPLRVVDLTLRPGTASVAYSGSPAPVRATSLPSVDEMRAELARRDEKLAELEKRLDEMQREHEEEFAILATLSGD